MPRTDEMLQTDEEFLEPGAREDDAVRVRAMREDDLARVVEIDAAATGHRRPTYFELMLQRALKESTLAMSLVAEVDGRVVGFVVATPFYGEYGVLEPAASLDAIGIHPDNRHRHVGSALMGQLRRNLGALRIETLRTEVRWDDFDLLTFFERHGFAPAGRLCLEYQLDPTAPE